MIATYGLCSDGFKKNTGLFWEMRVKMNIVHSIHTPAWEATLCSHSRAKCNSKKATLFPTFSACQDFDEIFVILLPFFQKFLDRNFV